MGEIHELLQSRKLFTVPVDTTVKDTVFYMAEKGVGLVPVMDNGKLIGVFSERDLVKRVIAENKKIEETRVDEVMTKELIVASADEANESILAKMKEARIRHILIIENEMLAGVLSMRDLLELDLSVCKTTVEVLNNYIYSK